MCGQRCQNAFDQLGTNSGERFTEDNFAKVFENCGHSFKPGVYPELFCKAAVARHCIPALRIAVQDMVDWAPDSLQCSDDIMLFSQLTALENFYACLFSQGLWLSPEAGAEAASLLQTAGLHHQLLTDMFMRRGQKLFLVTEKTHYVQHIAQDCIDLKLNPRFGWTYSDEDWMGRIAQVAKTCIRGRGPVKVSAPAIERWRTRMHTAWIRRRAGAKL